MFSHLHLFRKQAAGGTKSRAFALIMFTAYMVQPCTLGDTHYVSLSGSHTVPFTNWVTAATTIQAAVNATLPGDTVLVDDGVYETGSLITPGGGLLLNRVVITNAISVSSVNGPSAAIIKGQGPFGEAAVRCVYLAGGATLTGFTLTNGYTVHGGWPPLDMSGGGVVIVTGTVNNCVITGCRAFYQGGGVYGGVLNDCIITGNTGPGSGVGASRSTLNRCQISENVMDTSQGNAANVGFMGGGAYSSILYRCFITNNISLGSGGGVADSELYQCFISGNSAEVQGGGAFRSQLTHCTVADNAAGQAGGAVGCENLNSIVYFNESLDGNTNANNILNSTNSYTCSTPLFPGSGNITENPQLIMGNRLSLGSPCFGAGSAVFSTSEDIDGQTWLNPPSMGCDEIIAGSLTGSLQVVLLAPASSVIRLMEMEFIPQVEGLVTSNKIDFGDGSIATSITRIHHAWTNVGVYPVVFRVYNLTYPEGVATTNIMTVVEPEDTIRYVWTNSPSPGFPHASWATAAHDIQSAVDAQTTYGGWVVVTDGVHHVGSRNFQGASLSNRVVITNRIVLRSVNGPATTVIRGQGSLGSNDALRCVFVDEGSSLYGFTLQNGRTYTNGHHLLNCSGGGVSAVNGSVSNCVITGCYAQYGGGVYGGMIDQSTIEGNFALANGGGTIQASVYRSTIKDNRAFRGGGSYDSMLYSCRVVSNVATYGGGLSASIPGAYNSIFQGNVGYIGGGVYLGHLYNCTVVDNLSSFGGGVSTSHVYNSIVYYNRALSTGDNVQGSIIDSSCTLPAASGSGNITNAPVFANATTFELLGTSPGINLGSNDFAFGNSDINGDTRIIGTRVDMGAQEAAAASTGLISVAITAENLFVVKGYPIALDSVIIGNVTDFSWSMGDGSTRGAALNVMHTYTNTGNYVVTLSAVNLQNFASTSVTVTVINGFTNFVSLSGTHVSPFLDWVTAATNIQSAVDAAPPGSVIRVASGLYDQGEYIKEGQSFRVRMNKPLALFAEHPDPAMTVIRGNATIDKPICGIYAGSNTYIRGFTITNGVADTNIVWVSRGGGIRAEADAVVSNCIIRNNSSYYGGGIYGGSVYNSTIIHNIGSQGGGAYTSILYHCFISTNYARTRGGGAEGSRLYQCTISTNIARQFGGGVAFSFAENCVFTDNITTQGIFVVDSGGGIYRGTAVNSTFTGNRSTDGGAAARSSLYNCVLIRNHAARNGGGAHVGSVYNCTIVHNTSVSSGAGTQGAIIWSSIVISNTATSGAHNYSGTNVNNSCISPLLAGKNNTTNNPQFVGTNDFRLRASSPCVDKGLNQPWMSNVKDINGNTRVINSIVDMGAHELVFDATLKHFLQGPYVPGFGSMSTADPGAVTVTSPYADDDRAVETIPGNITDWVLVEVRKQTNTPAVFARSVFVRNDGMLVSDDGLPPVKLEVGTGTYFVVVRHRNHLSAMSAQTIAFTNHIVGYDFTLSPDQFYGGTNSAIDLGGFTWGVLAGDADGDGEIHAADEWIWRTQESD